MAEGYLRYYFGDAAALYSAGIETHGVNPRAIASMQEDGIDISGHTSNHVDEYAHIAFDLILTVCDHAQANCPYIPGNALRIHQAFSDPAKAVGDEASIRDQFRMVREEIKAFCRTLAEQYAA